MMNTQVTYTTDGETIITGQIETFAHEGFEHRLGQVLEWLSLNEADYSSIQALSILFRKEIDNE